MVTVITRDLQNYISSLSMAKISLIGGAYDFASKLINHAENKMKQYVKPRTKRSTGKLRQSINSEITVSSTEVRGLAYVPEGIKYQFLAESGRRKSGYIYPKNKKMLAFPPEHWKKAGRVNQTLSSQGNLLFYRVKIGKYKGMFFTHKAYLSTVNMYNKLAGKFLNRLVRKVFITRGF